MKNRIGFQVTRQENTEAVMPASEQPKTEARRSLVTVRFPSDDMAFTYYNDSFDLHRNDMVYVEGRREGERGMVTEVEYNFRIRLSDYKRVLAVVDTELHGTFHIAGSHMMTFDRAALPREKARLWFLPPMKDEEYVSGGDDRMYPLTDFSEWELAPGVFDRGHGYYCENRVAYLSLDGEKGYAVVKGKKPYEVEFICRDGMIGALTCDCFCSGICKHELAAVMQLRDLLDCAMKEHREEYRASGCLTAVEKELFCAMTMGARSGGTVVL